MKSHIEFFQTGELRVYLEDIKIRQELDKIKEARHLGTYLHKDGKKGWDYLFPSNLYNKIAKLVGIAKKPKKELLEVGELQNA